MRNYKEELELIANDFLEQNCKAKGNENKPNYSNRDFMNSLIIFQTALYDKIWDNMEFDKMDIKDRLNMSEDSLLNNGRDDNHGVFLFKGTYRRFKNGNHKFSGEISKISMNLLLRTQQER
jgi:hypothetical protein